MRSKPKSEKALLTKYRAKRRFQGTEATPEPTGAKRLRPRAGRGLRFVVQKHAASHLHYDFRLEADGVLKSWAVPKGPTLTSGERRLAMQVEDHPLDYFDFEGVIPAGNYGAGEVIVWDWGTYETADGGDPSEAIARGKIKLRMRGEKLRGLFTLVRMHGRGDDDRGWLLFKDNDDDADPKWSAEDHAESVKSGRTLADIKADPKAKTWISNRSSSRRRAKLPHVTTPMLATLIDAPFDDDDWLFEIKWDGFRALCTIHDDGHATLTSRNGKDFLAQFPSLEGLASSFTQRPILVDGEIVALDATGRSSFQRLQGRLGAKPPRVTFVVFDVLYADGRDLRGEPLERRKALLESIVVKGSRDVLYSKHVVGSGRALFEEASRQGLEGIIAKRRDAKYEERRTRAWVKIKAQKTQECVIAGFTDPGGARSDFGSLILGTYDRGKLRYAGNVGTGFTRDGLATLMKRMKPLAIDRCPFAVRPKTRTPAHWIKPKLVAQIRFTEWTGVGLMRHPAFLGLRDDKKPEECTREKAAHVEEVQ
jgi:bifunctional non-homologous end joining protein LigD